MEPHVMTQKILDYWKSTDAFKQSIESRSEKMPFSFFDGPPFTSGDPHYGHLLQSIVKDMVPRWMSMRGYRVPRKRGWDCHGIPAENFVNKKLGISSKKQVEEDIGIQAYIEACRTMVNDVNDNRQITVDQIGRWVDMENAYFTMDNAYMETVINVFSDLYERNLIYKGFKVLGYSWALGTSLSNHEINEGYEMRQDPAVTIKLPCKPVGSDEYASGQSGAIQVVVGIIDDGDALLQVYDTRSGVWFFPGGKVHSDETPQQALVRELDEELGVAVTEQKQVGSIIVPHGGVLYELIYFTAEIEGTPINREPEKQGAIGRVRTIESDNELGYVIKVDDLIIDDLEQMRRDFNDFFVVQKKLYALPGIEKSIPSMLIWTTTPWTLPSNMFAAVNKSVLYAMIYDHATQESFILADALVSSYYKDPQDYTEIFLIPGFQLVGCAYTPPFSYYHDDPTIKEQYKKVVHHVVHADFVTTDAGTGIAHEAPAFGEDDYTLVSEIFPKDHAQEWLFDPIDDHGSFTDRTPERAGINVIEANKPIISYLKEHNILFKQETINHSYPHCPRTKTPLIYKAIESRFVKEEQLKEITVPSAEPMLFIPESVKKRFINGLESAPDWNISRSRFWGCPLPVWENPENDQERLVVGSIDAMFNYNKPAAQLTKIIFVRHGRTDYNEKKRIDCFPADKSRLNALGEQQSEALVSYLQDHTVDHIYRSPLTRCAQMVQPFIDATGVAETVDERLQELKNYGFQDKAFDCSSISREGGPVDGADGETIQQAAERVKTFLEEVTRRHPGETIVICSHGDPLCLMRKHIYDTDYAHAKSRLYLNNKSLETLPVSIDYVRSESARYLDLHRPYIDQLHLHHPETGNCLERIPEVLDCWFESGSMPFAQNNWIKEDNVGGPLPVADFIAEGLDQTRGWFRALHVLGNAYIGKPVFHNTVVTGLILAEDGKKMSKSLNNFPNPLTLIEQYGADPLRLYMLSSPVIRAEPLKFAESGVEQMLKDFVIPLNNVWNFLSTYAAVDNRTDAGTRIHFMRHAHCDHTEESPRTSETPISEKGKKQITEKLFIEQVLRVQPDIIVSSDLQRAVDTAEGVRSIMNEYTGKDIEVVVTDQLALSMQEDTAGSVLEKIIAQYPGKSVLLVSHKKKFRYIWKAMTGHKESIHTLEMIDRLMVENTQIVALPLQPLINELDQWIYAELHAMLLELDSALLAYSIEPATRILLGFVDSLTNWYVRRSRRRFRASGMEQDKRSAYQTLWTVLETYLRAAAPFVPFVTEHIWQTMGKKGSVHHEYRPVPASVWINQDLIEEIATVRKIIKGALYIRAKNQIKVKQPLPGLEFSLGE